MLEWVDDTQELKLIEPNVCSPELDDPVLAHNCGDMQIVHQVSRCVGIFVSEVMDHLRMALGFNKEAKRSGFL